MKIIERPRFRIQVDSEQKDGERTPGLNVINDFRAQMLKKWFLRAINLVVGVFILLINVKMPTIVDILTFVSRINFVLSWVEHAKMFYYF